MDTASHLMRGQPDATTAEQAANTLDPRLQYLRVTVAGSSFFSFKAATLVATATRPAIQVWYTPAGEVIRLYEDGRVHSTAGIAQADWREARLEQAPSWQQAAQGQVPSYLRVRDVMPGYHSGLHDRVTVQPIAPPTQVANLLGLAPDQLNWFQEHSQLLEAERVKLTAQRAHLDPVHQDLPVARYAVDPASGRVVYSEQCLSAAVCLALQVWPPATGLDAPSAVASPRS
jgi:hypothetical protein